MCICQPIRNKLISWLCHNGLECSRCSKIRHIVHVNVPCCSPNLTLLKVQLEDQKFCFCCEICQLTAAYQLKGIVQHFQKYAYLLPCQDLDEKIDITVMYVQIAQFSMDWSSRDWKWWNSQLGSPQEDLRKLQLHKTATCCFYTSVFVMKYNVLICELQIYWKANFITFRQSYASCFPWSLVIILS